MSAERLGGSVEVHPVAARHVPRCVLAGEHDPRVSLRRLPLCYGVPETERVTDLMCDREAPARTNARELHRDDIACGGHELAVPTPVASREEPATVHAVPVRITVELLVYDE